MNALLFDKLLSLWPQRHAGPQGRAASHEHAAHLGVRMCRRHAHPQRRDISDDLLAQAWDSA